MTDALSESPLCRIEQALGRDRICVEEGCPFWETGRNGSPAGCAFDELDLSARGDLAQWLDNLRTQLETLRAEAGRETRHLFYERLNAGRSD